MLVLNVVVLHSILGFNVYYYQVVFTKKGIVRIKGLGGLDQLKIGP